MSKWPRHQCVCSALQENAGNVRILIFNWILMPRSLLLDLFVLTPWSFYFFTASPCDVGDQIHHHFYQAFPLKPNCSSVHLGWVFYLLLERKFSFGLAIIKMKLNIQRSCGYVTCPVLISLIRHLQWSCIMWIIFYNFPYFCIFPSGTEVFTHW